MNNDQIEQFKQFMEFIQNVDKYKQVINDLQTATNEYQDAYEDLSEGQAIATMRVKLEKDKVKFAQDSKDAQESFDKQTAATIYKLVSKESALGEREAELMQKERNLNERENQVKVNESVVQSRLDESANAAVALAAAMADVQARSIALTDKTTQIQKLLG